MNKILTKLLIGASVIFGGSVFTSCDNSLEYYVPTKEAINLVKMPDVAAYTGSQVWGTTYGFGTYAMTRGVDVNVNQWAEKYQCENATKELSDQDIEKIKELLSKGAETYNEVALPWPSYFVQQVYKGESVYYADDKDGNPSNTQVTGSNQMDKLVAWNGTEYEHINNFNDGNNTSNASCSLHNHLGTTLMTNMPTENINPNEQFGYHETWGNMNKDRNSYHYIIVEYNGDWYVGFDYHAECSDRNNPNEGKNVNRDWNFTDWIVRISPAYPINYDGDLWENDLDKKEDTGGDTGGSDIVIPSEIPNNVEVNLSIDRKEGVKWLASHLSIHVRANTDVKVFIPIPVEYICEADDLAIVQKHRDDLMVHGGPNEVKYNINNHEIILTITTTVDGITVETKGIQDSGVIEELQATYGDGLTFEIWNYFNIEHSSWYEGDTHTSIEPEALRDILNRSTITFVTNIPDLYVNAFNDKKDGTKFEDDCIVNVIDGQADNYNTGKTGWFYNGSPFNELYYKK